MEVEVEVGVSGSDSESGSGVVRASFNLGMCAIPSKCATYAKWGRVPTLGSPPRHVTSVEVTYLSSKLVQASSRLGTRKKHVSDMFPSFPKK
jgi:hypothetical protein